MDKDNIGPILLDLGLAQKTWFNKTFGRHETRKPRQMLQGHKFASLRPFRSLYSRQSSQQQEARPLDSSSEVVFVAGSVPTCFGLDKATWDWIQSNFGETKLFSGMDPYWNCCIKNYHGEVINAKVLDGEPQYPDK